MANLYLHGTVRTNGQYSYLTEYADQPLHLFLIIKLKYLKLQRAFRNWRKSYNVVKKQEDLETKGLAPEIRRNVPKIVLLIYAPEIRAFLPKRACFCSADYLKDLSQSEGISHFEPLCPHLHLGFIFILLLLCMFSISVFPTFSIERLISITNVASHYEKLNTIRQSRTFFASAF